MAAAGKDMEHFISLDEIWATGTAHVKVGNQEQDILFKFRKDFSLTLQESRTVKDCSLEGGLSPFEATQTARAAYQIELEKWLSFSPPSLKGGTQTGKLMGSFDFVTGRIDLAPNNNRQWDLAFICGPGGYEALRALEGVSWFELGVANFDNIKYRDLRDAKFIAKIIQKPGITICIMPSRAMLPEKVMCFCSKPQRET
jgi:hypothetical protein